MSGLLPAYHQSNVIICPEEKRHRVTFGATAVDGSMHSGLEHVIWQFPMFSAVDPFGEY